MNIKKITTTLTALALALSVSTAALAANVTLLNVSYDPTRENEAFLAINELGPDKFDVVTPSESILAEPPVTVIDKVADRRGTRKVAEAYLNYLYTDEGQKIAAKHYYRPINTKIPTKLAKVKLYKIDDKAFGGWQKAQKKHFADGGTFDQIYVPNK